MLQDIDVETLMQEIKQWGPQDQAAAPADRSFHGEPESQTPRRVSPFKEELPVTSASTSLTPIQAPTQEDSPSSHAKVGQEFLVTAVCKKRLTASLHSLTKI